MKYFFPMSNLCSIACKLYKVTDIDSSYLHGKMLNKIEGILRNRLCYPLHWCYGLSYPFPAVRSQCLLMLQCYVIQKIPLSTPFSIAKCPDKLSYQFSIQFMPCYKLRNMICQVLVYYSIDLING